MGLHFLIIGLAAAVQAAAAPPSEALIDRFIAVLPDIARTSVIDRTPDPQELERLTALNPGRAGDVRRVLEEKRACNSANENEATIAVMRRTALGLGASKVERLIAFYQGADYARFTELTGLAQQGQKLSSEQEAQIAQMSSSYGLTDFYEAFTAQIATFVQDTTFIQSVLRCRSQAEAALARLQFRTR